jgi:hypothetical protein
VGANLPVLTTQAKIMISAEIVVRESDNDINAKF